MLVIVFSFSVFIKNVSYLHQQDTAVRTRSQAQKCKKIEFYPEKEAIRREKEDKRRSRSEIHSETLVRFMFFEQNMELKRI